MRFWLSEWIHPWQRDEEYSTYDAAQRTRFVCFAEDLHPDFIFRFSLFFYADGIVWLQTKMPRRDYCLKETRNLVCVVFFSRILYYFLNIYFDRKSYTRAYCIVCAAHGWMHASTWWWSVICVLATSKPYAAISVQYALLRSTRRLENQTWSYLTQNTNDESVEDRVDLALAIAPSNLISFT